MIELVQDESERNGGAEEAPATVIGLGQAGIHVVDQLVMRGRERFEAIALDADSVSVDGSIAPEKATLGVGLCRGLGCYGDMALGRAVWKSEAERLQTRFSEVRQAVLALGLGGGAGSALAVETVKAIKRNEGRVVVVASLPFAFEPAPRQAAARRVLAELREVADAVLVFAADRADAWEESKQNIRKGLHGVNLAMARAVEASAQILASGGMNAISFADLRSLYGRFGEGEFRENCWLGRGEASVSEGQGLEALVAQVLSSPLLDGGAVFAEGKADSGMACLMTGHEFSLTDLKVLRRELEAALPKGFPLAFGTRTLDRHEGRLSLSLLLASTRPQAVPEVRTEEPMPQPKPQPILAEVPAPVSMPLPTKAKPAPAPVVMPEPVVAVVPAPALAVAEERNLAPVDNVVRRTKSPKPVKQEELPFEGGSRGRFENSSETIYNGENLDQPTFLRRRMAVKE